MLRNSACNMMLFIYTKLLDYSLAFVYLKQSCVTQASLELTSAGITPVCYHA